MRKRVFGRQFKRDKDERTALFKGLASSLVLHERIQTTEEKAKAIKGHVEKLVTKAKKGGLVAMQLLQPYLSEDAMKKIMKDIAPRFQNRSGGYTRIIRIGERLSDNARMVYIEWVEKKPVVADASVSIGVKQKPAEKTARAAKKTTQKNVKKESK